MTGTRGVTSLLPGPRIPSLRVLPASRGAWRVEDEAGTRRLCGTLAEAEFVADRLLRDLGGGQVLVYDAYLRLRNVRRLTSAGA